MAEEYLTFEQTAKKLGISEDELLNLVSDNRLRAFRINRETKFRVEDVESLDLSDGVAGAAMESAILDLDELPDDVVLLDEDSSGSGIGAQDTFKENADELLMLDEDEIPAAQEEEFEEAEALDIFEEPSLTDSSSELEETVITDSSKVTGTEELSLDDENFEFSTQEITIQEDAITEDEVSGNTSIDETIPVDDEEFTQNAGRGARRSHRASAARGDTGGSLRSRRAMSMMDAPKGRADLLWTGILGVLVLAMIYPVLLMSTVVFFGMTDGRDHIAPGQQTYDGTLGNIGNPFVPAMFKWIQTKNVAGYLGSPRNAQPHITFDERLRIGMIKFPSPVEMQNAPIEEAPAPVEDAPAAPAVEEAAPAENPAE